MKDKRLELTECQIKLLNVIKETNTELVDILSLLVKDCGKSNKYLDEGFKDFKENLKKQLRGDIKFLEWRYGNGRNFQSGDKKVNSYKYIGEIFKVKDSYVNGFLNLTNAIDRLLEFGYSYEEAKEYLNKEIII